MASPLDPTFLAALLGRKAKQLFDRDDLYDFDVKGDSYKINLADDLMERLTRRSVAKQLKKIRKGQRPGLLRRETRDRYFRSFAELDYPAQLHGDIFSPTALRHLNKTYSDPILGRSPPQRLRQEFEARNIRPLRKQTTKDLLGRLQFNITTGPRMDPTLAPFFAKQNVNIGMELNRRLTEAPVTRRQMLGTIGKVVKGPGIAGQGPVAYSPANESAKKAGKVLLRILSRGKIK
jgi:hypothetical protein